MLKHLEISNYALIRHTAVEFSDGYTVITGETGAGKSILLEAFALVLGSRANANAVRKGEEKCVIEATFTYDDPEVDALLERESLDRFETLILRRELTISGRSRAFVNDSPVSLGILKELAVHLVDLHGQQENISLQTPQYQVKQLDAFAGNRPIFEDYINAFAHFKTLEKQLGVLQEQAAGMRKDQDYYQFQCEELEGLKLDQEDYDAREQELSEMEHAEDIQRVLSAVSQVMQGEEMSAVSLLRKVSSELRTASKFTEKIVELSSRLDSALIEVEDIAAECDRLTQSIEYNPGKLDLLRNELDKIQRLMHKHVVSNVTELAAVRDDYRFKLDNIAGNDDAIAAMEDELAQAEAVMRTKGKELTASRNKAKTPFVEKLMAQVRKLGMEKAQVELRLTPFEAPGPLGMEGIELFFDANGSSSLAPLKDIASGGEVSRLMLALKSILSERDNTPTLIFDEIDTGVSGEVAKQIGSLMKEISKHTQLIAVTHLPGVASRGRHHFKIVKNEEKGEVVSRLLLLEHGDRIHEVAAMFSGKKLTEASLESARILLEEQ